MDYSKIRGFNYQPSYASTSFESWMFFDPQIWELEFRRGKDYFPGINALRLWLDWAAYIRNPERFVQNFATAVELCDRICGAKALPCLFNRWHNDFLDCGGIYMEHFMPGWAWLNTSEHKFDKYICDVVSPFISDERILAWDVCNEPFTYNLPNPELDYVEECEFQWLKHISEAIKATGAKQDVGISIHPHHHKRGLERVEPIEDVLFIHPYYEGALDDDAYKADWLKDKLDDMVAVSKASGKPLLITEFGWGTIHNDLLRTQTLEYSMQEYCKRNIGFIAHALNHSLVADLHDPEYGPAAGPGNLMFIGPDGKLRPHHDIFNKY